MNQSRKSGTAILYADNTISYAGNHGNGINNQDADDSTAVGNDISHFNHHGIDCKSSDFLTVQGNTVHDAVMAPSGFGPNVNDAGMNGIYSEAQTDNGRSSLSGGPYPAQGLTVEQNIIYNVQGSDGKGLGIQLDLYVAGDNKIYNNTIRNVQTGIGLYSGSGQVYNNAIDQVGVDSIENLAGYTEDYNELGRNISGGPGGGGIGAHDFSNNPDWVAPTANPPNFHLLPGSPCLNSGTTATGLPYTGSAPDRGAL